MPTKSFKDPDHVIQKIKTKKIICHLMLKCKLSGNFTSNHKMIKNLKNNLIMFFKINFMHRTMTVATDRYTRAAKISNRQGWFRFDMSKFGLKGFPVGLRGCEF